MIYKNNSSTLVRIVERRGGLCQLQKYNFYFNLPNVSGKKCNIGAKSLKMNNILPSNVGCIEIFLIFALWNSDF